MGAHQRDGDTVPYQREHEALIAELAGGSGEYFVEEGVLSQGSGTITYDVDSNEVHWQQTGRWVDGWFSIETGVGTSGEDEQPIILDLSGTGMPLPQPNQYSIGTGSVTVASGGIPILLVPDGSLDFVELRSTATGSAVGETAGDQLNVNGRVRATFRYEAAD